MKTTWFASLATAALLSGCTDSGHDTQDEIDSTGTLLVTATARTNPGNYTNSHDPAHFSTALSVMVARNNQIVSDASVTMTGSGDPIELGFQQTSGTYDGRDDSYDGTYTLDVVAGDDHVTGFTVEGPDIHWFTSPTSRETVPAGQPLTVEWERSMSATATISKWQSDPAEVDDSGSFVYDGALLTPQLNDFIELDRAIERTTDDGLASFTIGVTNLVSFAVEGQQ
jgi:hypothetical protein